MTAIVVFNPTNIPVSTVDGIVGSGEWLYVSDINSVSQHIAEGKLVVSKAPADPTQINPLAQNAFEQLKASEPVKENEQGRRKTRNNKSQSTTDTIEGE